MQTALLHSVSNYVPRMGLMASPWYDRYFFLKGGITCGNTACANSSPESLHKIGFTIDVPLDLATNNALATDLDTDLLGTFSATDVKMEPLRICNTVYLPAPFVRIFLERESTPVEA